MADVVNETDIENQYREDVGDITGIEDAYDHGMHRPLAGASAKNALAGSGRAHSAGPARKPALHIPGMPVFVPEAAMNPQVKMGVVDPGAGRSRDTMIVNRSERGKLALAARNIGSPIKTKKRPGTAPAPGEAEHNDGLRDFSHYYEPVQAKYNREYLNEVAYAESSTKRMLERRAIEQEREKRVEARLKAAYMAGGMKQGGRKSGSETSASDIPFFDRQEAVEKRKEAAITQARLEHEYAQQQDKLCCPNCGNIQTFAEVQARTRTCPRDGCNGAHYRPKLLWSEVQDSFLKRWAEFQKRKEKHDAERLAEDTVVARVTERNFFNFEKKRWVHEEVPEMPWNAVRHAFYKRNDETVARLKAREAEYLAALSKRVDVPAKTEKIVLRSGKEIKPIFKLKGNLPNFYDRQQAMLDRKNMTFEERAAELKDMTK